MLEKRDQVSINIPMQVLIIFLRALKFYFSRKYCEIFAHDVALEIAKRNRVEDKHNSDSLGSWIGPKGKHHRSVRLVVNFRKCLPFSVTYYSSTCSDEIARGVTDLLVRYQNLNAKARS